MQADANELTGPGLKLLLVGEQPATSAPSLTLAAALAPHGIESRFSKGVEAASTPAWLRTVRECDAIIYIAYGGPDFYSIRQLALAVALGIPVIRWWVGSDVLYCTENPVNARNARLLNRCCAERITGAPHLQRELASIGIKARLIPTIVRPEMLRNKPAPGPLPRGVLVYLPTDRGPFYGEEVIAQTICANPDLQFLVVADEKHRFRRYANVESLGWVSDMTPVYARTGCILRLTQHDSLPRMVIEGVLLGKYAIASYEFPGCWQARSFEEVQGRVAAFRNVAGPNTAGAAAMKRLLTPSPDIQFANAIRDAAARPRVLARLRALAAIVPLTMLVRLGFQFESPFGPNRIRRRGGTAQSPGPQSG